MNRDLDLRRWAPNFTEKVDILYPRLGRAAWPISAE
jgi:hypothetical protein